MKKIIKNLSEFIVAALILCFVLPIIVNAWDNHFSQFANDKIRQLRDAVERGESQKTIERLFGNLSTSKRSYRPVEVSVPEHATNNAVVKRAKELLFTPYRWGGTDESGVDCSGLTYLAYQAADIKIPRSVEQQFYIGAYIPRMNQLQIADLLFFATESPNKPTHVGLYVGENKMIHASSKGRKVLCRIINITYYQKRFLGGRRIVDKIASNIEE